MTSAIATIGLSFDGTDLQSDDLQIFLEIVHGLNETPAVRGIDTVVPAKAGRTEGNRKNDVLAIELEGIVRANPETADRDAAIASYRTNVQVIRSLFASNRGRAELVATLEDGSIVSIMARPMPGMIWTEPVKSEFAQVSIELEGYDDWAPLGS